MEQVARLTHVPHYLRRYAEVAISSIQASVSRTKTYYPSTGPGDRDGWKPDSNWVLLALAYFIESYLTCCVSVAEENMVKYRGQYKVYVSCAEYHVRHLIMAKQVPMEAVLRADSAESIRNPHTRAKDDARRLSELATGMGNVGNVRGLLSAFAACSVSPSSGVGAAEQAHTNTHSLSQKCDAVLQVVRFSGWYVPFVPFNAVCVF